MTIANRQLSADRIKRLVADKDVATLESALFQLAAMGGLYKPAVVALIDIGTNDAWDALGRFLSQSQSAAVSFTLADLEEVVRPGVARAVGAALGNPSANIRRAAVRALVRQEVAPAIPHLVRAARDPDPEVARVARVTVVQHVADAPKALAKIPERMIEGVFDLLEERRALAMVGENLPENVRIVAALRVARFGDEEATDVLARLLTSAEGRLAEACWMGLEHSPSVNRRHLEPLLNSQSAETKARSLTLFTRIAKREDAKVFASNSRAPEPDVRAAAITGMARVLGAESIPTLAAALDDSEEEIGRLAIGLLAEIPESTPQLLKAVKHEDSEIRKQAMIHLADRGVITDQLMPSYFELVRSGRTCTDPSDTKFIDSLTAIARSLGENQVLEGLSPLADLARATLRPLRRTAIESIMKYDAHVRADTLYDLAETYDQDVLKNVAMGLWEVRDGRVHIPMIRVSRECRGAVVRRAKKILAEFEELNDSEFVIRLLTQPFASVRRFAAEKLLDFQDPIAIPALLVASRDEDVDVQLAVFEALSPFAADHDDVRARMLEAIGYGDVSIRQAACQALGEARCKEAVPQLIKALYNGFLRRRAMEALRRIGDRMGMLAIKRLERREKMFPKKRGLQTISGRKARSLTI